MSLVPPPVLYALARSGESWPEVALDGLEVDVDGDLLLRRVPGLMPPSISQPGAVAPSGLALDCDCGLYVADTAGNRIVRFGLDCHTEVAVPGVVGSGDPGVVKAPAGMCWGPGGWLFVATGDGRILVFATPALALRDAWGGFSQPTFVACDEQAIIVVDVGVKRVLRFDPRGVPDQAFNDNLKPPTGPPDPGAAAVDADGTIYVADKSGGGVWPFKRDGATAGGPIASGNLASALAISDRTLYLADVTSGEVRLFSLPDGRLLGSVYGFRGPVSALAVGHKTLFIKTALDASFDVAQLASAYKTAGTLQMGPLDAGKESAWARAAAWCEVPPLADAELAWYTDSSPTPLVITWQVAPSLDLLLPGSRYLWVRVTLSSRDPSVTPTLHQVRAQTAGDSYLRYLPYVYSRDPDPGGLTKLAVDQANLSQYEPGDLDYLRLLYSRSPAEGNQIGRLLDLTRTQLGALEENVDDLPRNFDPATAPVELLDWLASWLAFDVPARLSGGGHTAEIRQLLLGLAVLFWRRGTLRGVADLVEIYTGVRPFINEDYRERPLWILGETGLGFGSGLPDRDVEGLLVGDAVVGETGPEDPRTIGSALFESTAHRFSVIVPVGTASDDAQRSLIRAVLVAEKPAHTAFHVCFAEPRMRIGVQARIGVDALVAAGPDPLTLGSTSVLDMNAALLGLADNAGGVVGSHGQIGIDTRLG